MTKSAPNNAYLFTDDAICIYTAGEQFTVPNDHPNIDKIKKAISENKFNKIKELLDVRGTVKQWISTDRSFKLENDLIELEGVPFSEAITFKVLSMIERGHNPDPLFSFLRKVRQNPSKTAQNELLLFCVANNFMIHEDGDIIAYKGVRSNYTDIHSGKIRNEIGDIVYMERGQVDDDRGRTCSTGLHFASYEYASTWSDQIAHVMIMKINPEDVVSIPSDYDNQKGRCCSYEVISELKDRTQKLPLQEVYTDSDWDECDCDCREDIRWDECNCESCQEIRCEIDRKCAIRDRWQDRLDSGYKGWYLQGAIEQIDEEIDDLRSQM